MSAQAAAQSCQLHDLVPAGVDVSDVPNLALHGIAIDSREVVEGALFIAVPGTRVDGHDYIQAAVSNGAAAVFASQQVADCEVPLIVISDLPQQVSALASAFFAHPSRSMRCVAVTGTNGKTSVAHFVAQLAAQLGFCSGFLGTTGWGLVDSTLEAAELTTADAVTLQRRLFELNQRGAELVALELSSHALAQYRGDGVDVDVALFTNLSRDHLDYHGDMASYGAAKARLFEFETLRGSVITAEDEFGVELVRSLKDRAGSTYALGRDGGHHELVISDMRSSAASLSWVLTTPWGEVALESPIIGSYNATNLSLAVAALCLLGSSLEDVARAVPDVIAPAGRLQRVHTPVTFAAAVYVDYAHTPDALESVLKASRAHCDGRLICVFGCGGDRDRGKRAFMGQAVIAHADIGVLTSDNPRHEDPLAIIADVLEGVGESPKLHVEQDRQKAIAHALTIARSGDLVIVAGKGHEDYQDIGGAKLPFDDAVVVARLLDEAKVH